MKQPVILKGSHRSNGQSSQYVDRLVEELKKNEIYPQVYDINRLTVKPCIDCSVCSNSYGKCVHDDDMESVYKALKATDVLIVASPVYFNGITSKLKQLVDRCQMIFICDFKHGKPYVENTVSENKQGYIISLGGANAYTDQFTGNALSLGLVFRNLRMPLTEHFTYAGTDHKEVLSRNEAKDDIEKIVQNLKDFYQRVGEK